jgi:hypothetical protein
MAVVFSSKLSFSKPYYLLFLNICYISLSLLSPLSRLFVSSLSVSIFSLSDRFLNLSIFSPISFLYIFQFPFGLLLGFSAYFSNFLWPLARCRFRSLCSAVFLYIRLPASGTILAVYLFSIRLRVPFFVSSSFCTLRCWPTCCTLVFFSSF